MPHPKKKQRVTGDEANYSVGAAAASANDLSVDLLANILGYLCGAKDIMPKRRVCRKWSEAVKKTIVPLVAAFVINSVEKYNAANVMIRAMPNLQQIKIGYLGYLHKYNDGEDPHEYERRTALIADWTSHDIGIISNFSKLRDLTIDMNAPLNGRYDFLFNSFPLLQKLSIQSCTFLKWDLGMLAGMPLLQELECEWNPLMTGNIRSLRVLEDSLERLSIFECEDVEGNIMDLADFPHLKELKLDDTAVTGDMRDIGENDFPSLKKLDLPKGVYGGMGYEFQRISDGPDLIRTLYRMKKQHLTLQCWTRYWKLSGDSPEWYEITNEYDETPPFYICFVKAGSRIGYRWENIDGTNPCEVNWLDPEPDRGSSDYEKYIEELQEIQGEVGMYEGFHQPPTEDEYNRLLDRFEEEGGWW